jgi:hypothetical protein
MARLIDIQRGQPLPASLTVRVGDVLMFEATGGHVHSGSDLVEILGPFVPGVVGDNGEILSPMGAPNAVLFLLHGPGRASIDVVTGDPWSASQTMMLELTVDP